MFDRLQPQSPDALLALIKLFAADPRPDKIDLGVGVYRTDDGATPVFAAIKEAEARLLARQDTKSYLGPEGDMGFVGALTPHIFGADARYLERVRGMQTPGGTGAVRLAIALAKRGGVTAVHLGTPSWPNHAQIIADVALDTRTFAHANPDGSANVDAALSVIAAGGASDAILLHACCHNPTGIDYSRRDWDRIATALSRSAVFPIIDSAYQGLGEGFEADSYAVRAVCDAVPQALVAYSCDKNFGMYRDRVGALYALASEQGLLDTITSNLNALARACWSMPPDHGAAAVRLILEDAELTALWLNEVEDMRGRMRAVRAWLADAGQIGALDLTALGEQHGLFSILPLSPAQIQTLRDDHAIYMAGSGRINIAGLTGDNIGAFIAALRAVA